MEAQIGKGKTALSHRAKLTRIAICLVIMIIGMLLNMRVGAVEYTLPEIIQHTFRESEGIHHVILANVRLPRILVAAMVGINLALAGSVMQGITRNPMASPSVLGVSSGAALVTIVFYVFFPTAFYYSAIAAIIGAFLTTLLIYAVAWKNGIAPVRFILSGVAIASVLGAFYSVISVLYPDAVKGMIGFSVGSLNARTWMHFKLILPYAVVGVTICLLFANQLNILSMGDEIATGLGLPVEKIRMILIITCSLLAGSSIAVVGQIGFIGLCVPHITRMLIGSDYRYLLPASAINGASMVLYCDLVARVIIKPEEMNVGIIIAAIGAPFFLYLLRRKGGYNQ